MSARCCRETADTYTPARKKMAAVTILVVDDDAASRESLHDVLADAGYQVTAVSSARKAWRR